MNGCIQKDKDIFWVNNKSIGNENDIKLLIETFKTGINTKDVNKVMNCFDVNINFPDALNPTINVTYQSLLYGYIDFFKKTEKVSYEFNDQFIIINENYAKVTIKLRKKYVALSPFFHVVDNVVPETIFIAKTSENLWRITKIYELLPPRIY